MTDDRWDRGIEFLRKYRTSDAVDAMIESLNARSPRYAAFSIASSFGEVYQRDGLEDKYRELVTIAVVASIGATEGQIKTHVDLGLRMGLDPVEIVETMVQVAAYAGAPRASAAMLAVGAVFAEHGITPPE